MTQLDRTLESIGLPHHPKPKVLAQYLRSLANTVETDAARATQVAALLAARGWAGGTLGDGGSRSTDSTSSTERAAGADQETKTPTAGRYAGVDRRLATALRAMWKTGLLIEELVSDLLSHGDDVDELPAGSGTCECCERFCRPGVTGSTEDRLRAGLCPACHQAWMRTDRNDRGGWLIARRQSLRAALERGRTPAELVGKAAAG